MNKRSSLSIFLILTILAPILGQAQSPQQQERQSDDEEVVRIATNLIQFDAVVTDKNGKPVTDLRQDEFEIEENGEKQAITNFSYVSVVTEVPSTRTAATTPDKNAPPAPPAPPLRLGPDQARRTIAIVVDDLGLSAQSIPYVRRALKKFVDEQMQPSDLVAIIRTGGSGGILQKFTSDKQQLLRVVDRVRWNTLGRGGVSPFAPIEGGDISDETSAELPGASDDGISSESLDEFRGELFTVGTLGALSYIVQGLKDMPGRKSLMLLSDGVKIRDSEGRSDRIMDALRRLTEIANRASVVIYTLDARGLPTLELSAADNTRGMRPSSGGAGGRGGRGRGGGSTNITNPVDQRLLQRRVEYFESQQGMNYLAEETGGIAMRNSNDLTGGLSRMLADQQGYYLIAYRPNDETFDPKQARFNKLKIKVKRSGLKVRYRSGFFGVPDEVKTINAKATRAQQLARSINSPFVSSGLDVRLTSLFANDATAGSFMRSLLHVDADKLTFVEEPDGWHKLVFDVMAVTFGDNGTVVDEVSRTETVRLRGETHTYVLKNGFDYIVTVPIKKPGAYQLRAAVRDTASERIGSATQFIEVPDLGKNRLALSGIIVNGYDPANLTDNASGTKATVEPQTGPGVRRLRRGLVLEFGYVIYNAQLDKATQRPKLQTQLRLFRDGKLVQVGSVQPFDPGAQTDLMRLNAGGRLQIGTDMAPGDYVLQVIVTDTLAKEKQRITTQWIDFQIQ